MNADRFEFVLSGFPQALQNSRRTKDFKQPWLQQRLLPLKALLLSGIPRKASFPPRTPFLMRANTPQNIRVIQKKEWSQNVSASGSTKVVSQWMTDIGSWRRYRQPFRNIFLWGLCQS
jgi:hypothetical protein